MQNFKTYALITLAAFFYTLGFPNIFRIYIPFLPLFGTAIIVYFIVKAQNTKMRLLYYFYYNTIINALSFYWITKTLQEFGNIPFIFAALMNGAFSFIFNPQFVLFIIILKISNYYFPKIQVFFFNSGRFCFILAMLFTLMEYFIPQQFPVMLGQPWIILSEYLGAAAYFGIPIYSFMSYLLAFEFIHFTKSKRFSFFNLASILLFIVINPFLLSQQDSIKTQEFNIRLVQANISNFLKVDSESGAYASTQQVLTRYDQLSIKNFSDPHNSEKKIDLIVWPETAYPYPLYTDKDDITQTMIPPLFSHIVNKTGAAVFLGGYDHFKSNEDGGHFKTEYNAGLFINTQSQLEKVYHKHILIPFGETLPLGPLNKWASSLLPEMAFFAEGKSFPLFKTEKNIKFISSICYEILRPEFVRKYLNNVKERPHLMINLTNDSWHGDTVEPEQHLFLARWRAIEFNLPILRSTNTGISTYIKSDGQEQSRLSYGHTGNLDLTLNLSTVIDNNNQTIYQQFGILSMLPIWILYFIFHIILLRLKND